MIQIIGAKGIAKKWTQDHVPETQGIKFSRGKEGKIEKVMDSSAKEICSNCSGCSQDKAHGILQNPPAEEILARNSGRKSGEFNEFCCF